MSSLPTRRSTLRDAAGNAAASSMPQPTRPSALAERAIDSRVAPPDVSRPAVLKRSVADIVRRTREKLGMSQTQFAASCGTSRHNADRWENPDDPCAPNMMHLALLQRDAALPLNSWCLAHHDQQLHAAPVLRHASDMLRFADLTRAVSNAARAAACMVEGRELSAMEWEMVRTTAHRLVDCAMELEARATAELQSRKARGR